MSKNQKGFSIIEIFVVFTVIIALGAAGWYVWHKKQVSDPQSSAPITSTTSTRGWKNYSNPCLNLKFKAPANIFVDSIIPTKEGDCTNPLDYQGPNNVNTWAQSAETIGQEAPESVQSGPSVEFIIPLPVNNSFAMKVAGLTAASSTSELLHTYVADKSNNASFTNIGGHLAAVSYQVNSNQKPKDFQTVDQPYCPCTSKTVFLDNGSGDIIPIYAHWLNSDKSSAEISNTIISSITFIK